VKLANVRMKKKKKRYLTTDRSDKCTSVGKVVPNRLGAAIERTFGVMEFRVAAQTSNCAARLKLKIKNVKP
jgi:hypothetical protein